MDDKEKDQKSPRVKKMQTDTNKMPINRSNTIDLRGHKPPEKQSIQDRINANSKRIRNKELKLMSLASNAPTHKTMNVRASSPGQPTRKKNSEEKRDLLDAENNNNSQLQDLIQEKK